MLALTGFLLVNARESREGGREGGGGGGRDRKKERKCTEDILRVCSTRRVAPIKDSSYGSTYIKKLAGLRREDATKLSRF